MDVNGATYELKVTFLWSPSNSAPATSNGLPPSTTSAANTPNHQDASGQTAPPTKRRRLKEAIEIDDLVPTTSATPVVLKLERTDRYYHGPTPVDQSQYSSSSEVMHAVQHVKHQLMGPQTNLTKVLASTTAGVVTNELTPGGALMGRNTAQPLHSKFSDCQFLWPQKIKRCKLSLFAFKDDRKCWHFYQAALSTLISQGPSSVPWTFYLTVPLVAPLLFEFWVCLSFWSCLSFEFLSFLQFVWVF